MIFIQNDAYALYKVFEEQKEKQILWQGKNANKFKPQSDKTHQKVTPETIAFLKEKGFNNTALNYFTTFIERENKKSINITFQVTYPTPTIACAINVEYCDCVTSCCGIKAKNFIIQEDTFDSYIEHIVKLIEKNEIQ